jgi:hypothetical protein
MLGNPLEIQQSLKKREAAVAALAFTAAISAMAPITAGAADKAKTKAAGTYVSGDFHNHTTCSDGTLSVKKLVDKSAGTFNLDWFVQADHGGSSYRNCTLAEDPFEPVAPATGLNSSSTGPWPPATYPAGGQPATAGKGPNQPWETTLPNGRADIKGDLLESTVGGVKYKNMYRWQEIKEYQYPVLEAESRNRKRPIWIGVEQNAPGHEHVSTNILSGQKPWPATTVGNAALQAQYEYCFDRSDADTSRGAENQWDCSVTGSANNSLIDATAKKITGNNSANTQNLGHLKTLEGIKWMKQMAPTTSYFVPAHLERAGAYNPSGSNGFNVEHLRDFNNTAPDIAFGFESMPGHQADPARGSYSTGAVGGGTYGGTGVYAAAVGGVWDALLGEGRNWWFFASSDYHNRGSFGPDQRETNADFFPGEYTRDYVMVRKGADNLSAEGIINGLRSGNSFVANGNLVDKLSFVVCAYNPVVPRTAFKALMEKASANAVAKNGEVRIDGCATMGEKLKVPSGTDLLVTVTVNNPKANSSPYSFPNPSLKQIGITQPLNAPVLDHVDLIGGNVTGFVDPSAANYGGALGSAAATNSSTKVLKVFNSTSWTASADGKTLTMSYKVPAAKVSQYFRLRGTNLPASTPGETDPNGNPLLDFVSNPSDQTLPGLIACTDAACPAHLRTVNGVKYSSFDVAGWSDLWFYANPVYVEVIGATVVAGLK